MITKAYIHEYGNGKLEPEHSAVKATLESRGIDCELFTTKKLRRNQLQLDKSTLVVGDHPTIKTVFKRIGYTSTTDCYPSSIRPYLKRNVWETTTKRVMMELQSKDFSNVFIKPKDRAKLFTGFVVNSNKDLYSLNTISKNATLYCSSVVQWLSEYRVFVNDSKIVGIKNYDGAADLPLNRNEVENAIIDFEKSPNSTSAYGIDFGVLKSGETALVEWNDGFALGAYGLDKEIYTDLILSRWQEVLDTAFAE